MRTYDERNPCTGVDWTWRQPPAEHVNTQLHKTLDVYALANVGLIGLYLSEISSPILEREAAFP